jgi:hypothetical protein
VTVKVTQGRGEIVGSIEVAHGATRSLDAGNALKWSGATPLRCHGNRGGRSRPHVCCYARHGRRGIGMLLTIQRSYELLAKYQFFAREICDTCGIVLGAVRFTRHNESEVYCSCECRGDAHRSATLRRGRPRKYKTDRERRAAKTRQEQVYRSHPNVEKTVRIQSETKGLDTQKSSLSQYPLSRPLWRLERTGNGPIADSRAEGAQH